MPNEKINGILFGVLVAVSSWFFEDRCFAGVVNTFPVSSRCYKAFKT
jgi:hypothetical protein